MSSSHLQISTVLFLIGIFFQPVEKHQIVLKRQTSANIYSIQSISIDKLTPQGPSNDALIRKSFRILKIHPPREASSKSSCNAASCSSGVMPSDPVASATGTFGENHRELIDGWTTSEKKNAVSVVPSWGKNMAHESFIRSPWLKGVAPPGLTFDHPLLSARPHGTNIIDAHM